MFTFLLQDLRELKLQLGFMREENDRLRNDLADLTKLSEMLNVKFKLMSHEKEKLKEQSEEATFSFQDARDQVHELSCKFNGKFSFLFLCPCTYSFMKKMKQFSFFINNKLNNMV